MLWFLNVSPMLQQLAWVVLLFQLGRKWREVFHDSTGCGSKSRCCGYSMRWRLKTKAMVLFLLITPLINNATKTSGSRYINSASPWLYILNILLAYWFLHESNLLHSDLICRSYRKNNKPLKYLYQSNCYVA